MFTVQDYFRGSKVPGKPFDINDLIVLAVPNRIRGVRFESGFRKMRKFVLK